MELAKLILKLVYVAIIFAICFLIAKRRLDTIDTSVIVVCFLVSVLCVYFTFDYIYNILVDNEIVIQKTNNTNRQVEEDESTPAVIDKKPQTINHNHQYIKNKIFA